MRLFFIEFYVLCSKSPFEIEQMCSTTVASIFFMSGALINFTRIEMFKARKTRQTSEWKNTFQSKMGFSIWLRSWLWVTLNWNRYAKTIPTLFPHDTLNNLFWISSCLSLANKNISIWTFFSMMEPVPLFLPMMSVNVEHLIFYQHKVGLSFSRNRLIDKT